MLDRLWKQLTRIGIILACILAFLAFMELLRTYQTLHQMHPHAGYAFALLAAVLIIWAIGMLLGGWKYRPRTLTPPETGDVENADLKILRKYARYLVRYLRRLAENPNLTQQQNEQAEMAASQLAKDAPRCRERQTIIALIQQAESTHVEPLLAVLDEKAEQEVHQCVLHVMVGVAASVWNSIDVLIVLYRNGRMVSRVTEVYNAKPPLRERVNILIDTIRVVAMIKVTSMTANLLTKSGKVMPLVGRATESLAQAVGAGVLTSAAGHAAKHRCRAFRGWDRCEAEQHLSSMVGQYLKDCWSAARKSVWPIITQTIGDAGSSVWDKVQEGFSSAVDATAAATDSFVRKPVAAGANAVTSGGRSAYVRSKRSLRRLFRW